MPLSDSSTRLLDLAKRQTTTIRDHEVFLLWGGVVDAIWFEWLTPSTLPQVIDALSAGRNWDLAEESWIEVLAEDPGRVELMVVAETWQCPRSALILELQRLASSFADRTPPPSDAEPAIAEEVLERLRQLLTAVAPAPDAPLESPATPEAERIRAEAQTALIAWARSLADAAPADQQWLLGDLTDTDRAQLDQALRSFAEWAEHPTGAGIRVDAVIAALEQRLGPLLEHGRAAREAETSQRIADAARSSIAQRLREAGAPPAP